GIANNLRGATRALSQASKNGEQASAELNVAEGGTSAIESILERMKELAAQSASSNSGDRAQLQAEFNTLRTEIQRITQTTQYHARHLIGGSTGNQPGTTAGSTMLDDANAQASTVKLAGTRADSYTIKLVDATHLSMTDGAGDVQVVQVAATGVQTVNF